MRQKAIGLEIGTDVFIHGFLKTEHTRTEDEKLRGMYYIRPRKLIITQKTTNNVDADDF